MTILILSVLLLQTPISGLLWLGMIRERRRLRVLLLTQWKLNNRRRIM